MQQLHLAFGSFSRNCKSEATDRGPESPRITMALTSVDIYGFITSFLLTSVSVGGYRDVAAPAPGHQTDATAADETITQLRYSIFEEVPKGTLIADLTLDAGLKRQYSSTVLSTLEFRVLNPPPLPFLVDMKTGIIRTDGVVDRDSLMQCKDRNLCEINLDVTVRPTQYFQIIKVTIDVDDINDNEPYFRMPSTTISIKESAAVGTRFALPLASDLDSPEHGVQTYELMCDETTDLGLGVTARRDGTLEAQLVVQNQLDREMKAEYRLSLIAYDGGRPPKSASTEIVVVVLDSNDHSPVFARPTYEVNITENIATGTVIAQVSAIDLDEGINGEVMYWLSPQTEGLYGGLFAIDNRTGEISVHGSVDYEKFEIYQLAVMARDLGPGSLPSDASVVVRVTDVNDNSPIVTVSTLSSRQANQTEVQENMPVGSFVAHISIIDLDSHENGRVTCNVSENAFTLIERYSTEFQLVTAVVLDRETQDRYGIELVCWDGGHPTRTSVKRLTVVVSDANDNRPRFTNSSYSARLVENNPIGSVVLQVSALDKDIEDNGRISYSISPAIAAADFDIDSDGFIIAKVSVDREKYSSYSFTVLAVDRGTPPQTGTALVAIAIEDVNDEKPIFGRSSYSFSVYENEPEGKQVGSVTAEDRDSSPNNFITYAFASGQLTHERFAIDKHTGNLYTINSLDREDQAVYRLIVTATDKGKPPCVSTASVMVYVLDKNDHDPVFQFPLSDNNNLYISNAVPHGFVITQVIAQDADQDSNGRVRYELLQDDVETARHFTINNETGIISVNIRFHEVAYRDYVLTIIARDDGAPQRSTLATLFVHVNQSVSFAVTSQSSIHVVDIIAQNAVVIALIVFGSAAFTVIMLVPITVVARRYRRRRKTLRSNKCCSDALREMAKKEISESSTPAENVPLTQISCSKTFPPLTVTIHNGDSQLKEVANATDLEDDSLHSGKASNADSGTGHSEEEELVRTKHDTSTMTLASSSKSKDYRFQLPPPPPPLLSYRIPQLTLQKI